MQQPDLFTVSHAPVRGRTPRARHASWTGAQAQTVVIWTAKQSALLQCLASGSPMTRNELAAVLMWPITSVCSILDALVRRGFVEASGDYDVVRWDAGRQTKRERFQVKR